MNQQLPALRQRLTVLRIVVILALAEAFLSDVL